MKILNSILAILFFLFAIVQYNDPDPVKWILIYGLVAGICGFAAVGKKSKIVNLATIAIIVIWMGILLPEFINWIKLGMPSITETMKVEAPHIEYTREFLGLLLALMVLVFQYFKK